jgi:hypothetical protein
MEIQNIVCAQSPCDNVDTLHEEVINTQLVPLYKLPDICDGNGAAEVEAACGVKRKASLELMSGNEMDAVEGLMSMGTSFPVCSGDCGVATLPTFQSVFGNYLSQIGTKSSMLSSLAPFSPPSCYKIMDSKSSAAKSYASSFDTVVAGPAVATAPSKKPFLNPNRNLAVWDAKRKLWEEKISKAVVDGLLPADFVLPWYDRKNNGCSWGHSQSRIVFMQVIYGALVSKTVLLDDTDNPMSESFYGKKWFKIPREHIFAFNQNYIPTTYFWDSSRKDLDKKNVDNVWSNLGFSRKEDSDGGFLFFYEDDRRKKCLNHFRAMKDHQKIKKKARAEQ